MNTRSTAMQPLALLLDAGGLIAAQREFAAARDWERFHTPRNLMLALTGEVGELAELFQWKNDAEVAAMTHTPHEFERLQEELADVMMYLVRLADVCGVDLDHALRDKLRKNAQKYPAPDSE